MDHGTVLHFGHVQEQYVVVDVHLNYYLII